MTEQQLLLRFTKARLEITGLSLLVRSECSEPWLSAEGSIIVREVSTKNLAGIFRLAASAIGLPPTQSTKFSASCIEAVMSDLHRYQSV